MTATQIGSKVKGFRARGNYPQGEAGNTYRTALANLLVRMKDRATASRVFDSYKTRVGERDVSLEESPRCVRELTADLYEADVHRGLNGNGPYRNSLFCLKRSGEPYWVATLDGQSYQDGPAHMWDLHDQEVIAVLEVRKKE